MSSQCFGGNLGGISSTPRSSVRPSSRAPADERAQTSGGALRRVERRRDGHVQRRCAVQAPREAALRTVSTEPCGQTNDTISMRVKKP